MNNHVLNYANCQPAPAIANFYAYPEEQGKTSLHLNMPFIVVLPPSSNDRAVSEEGDCFFAALIAMTMAGDWGEGAERPERVSNWKAILDSDLSAPSSIYLINKSLRGRHDRSNPNHKELFTLNMSGVSCSCPPSRKSIHLLHNFLAFSDGFKVQGNQLVVTLG